MAYAKIYLENPHTGQMREAPVGFSWTTLFFGMIPAIFRGHWVGAIIQLLCACVTFGLSGVVFSFIYNKMYINYLIKDGFKVKSATTNMEQIERRLQIKLPMLPKAAEVASL